jgi:hypothetical protein
MAGILTAGDTISSFAKSVGQGMQQASASMANEEQKTQQTNAPMESNGHINQEVEATQ